MAHSHTKLIANEALNAVTAFNKGHKATPWQVFSYGLNGFTIADLSAYIIRVKDIPVKKGIAPIYKVSKMNGRIGAITRESIVFGSNRAQAVYVQEGAIITRDEALVQATSGYVNLVNAYEPLELNMVFDDGELCYGFAFTLDQVLRIGIKQYA